MFCDRCGTKIEDGQNFCPSCGKPIKVNTLMPQQARVAGHIRLLGILWIAYSAVHLIPGLFLIAIFHTAQTFFPPGAPAFVPGLLQGVGFGLSAASIVGLIAGWGLLNWTSWARTLSIVLGVINMLSLPFGTALGVYTLWVLLPENSEREYRERAVAAF